MRGIVASNPVSRRSLPRFQCSSWPAVLSWRVYPASLEIEPSRSLGDRPILKPYLHRSLRHVDILRDSLPHRCRGGSIFTEFEFQCQQLILGRSLALLVLLLLRQSAFSWRAARIWIPGRGGRCGGRRRGRRHHVESIGGLHHPVDPVCNDDDVLSTGRIWVERWRCQMARRSPGV